MTARTARRVPTSVADTPHTATLDGLVRRAGKSADQVPADRFVPPAIAAARTPSFGALAVRPHPCDHRTLEWATHTTEPGGCDTRSLPGGGGLVAEYGGGLVPCDQCGTALVPAAETLRLRNHNDHDRRRAEHGLPPTNPYGGRWCPVAGTDLVVGYLE